MGVAHDPAESGVAAAHFLRDGAAQVPGYDADTRAQRAGVLAAPVSLERDVWHAAAAYGAVADP